MRTGSILGLQSSGAIMASLRSNTGDTNIAATGMIDWQVRKEERREPCLPAQLFILESKLLLRL